MDNFGVILIKRYDSSGYRNINEDKIEEIAEMM